MALVELQVATLLEVPERLPHVVKVEPRLVAHLLDGEVGNPAGRLDVTLEQGHDVLGLVDRLGPLAGHHVACLLLAQSVNPPERS